ncbi:MAG: hypothetical protein MAG453_01778 [Calditrichaeota bacterium]|nr:hypothetical protein [Calditrichota bacterium]
MTRAARWLVVLAALVAILSRPAPVFAQDVSSAQADTSSMSAPRGVERPAAYRISRMDSARVEHGVPLSKSPTGAALRSAILPGWGQAYTGNWIKAAVFLGVDVGFLYGAAVQHTRYLDARELSEKTKTDAEQRLLERTANFYRDDRNKLLWWTAGVTLLSVFDAYVEAHLYDFRIDPNVESAPSGDGVQVGMTVTFAL